MYVVGPEYGVPYTLTGPDGSVAVFNDPTSPYYAGVLNPEECSGLDSAESRENAQERTEQDGAIQGNNWYGKRPVILAGTISPISGAVQRSEMAGRIMQASNAMRGDATLAWTPEGGETVFVKGRRNSNGVKIVGPWIKKFQMALTCADPRIYSAVLNTTEVASSGGVEGGRTYDKTYDYKYGATSPTGIIHVINNGWGESPPIVRVWGPGINPSIINNTTGQAINLVYTLNAEEYLELDFFARTITLGGTASRYYAMQYETSEWWYLQPGSNEIRLTYASFETGAKMQLFYRDAWV